MKCNITHTHNTQKVVYVYVCVCVCVMWQWGQQEVTMMMPVGLQLYNIPWRQSHRPITLRQIQSHLKMRWQSSPERQRSSQSLLLFWKCVLLTVISIVASSAFLSLFTRDPALCTCMPHSIKSALYFSAFLFLPLYFPTILCVCDLHTHTHQHTQGLQSTRARPSEWERVIKK